MKVSFAARFAGLTYLIATIFTVILMRPGLKLQGVLLPRQVWFLDNIVVWQAGWWLWMIAIFAWMLLLITLMWGYMPAHRVATMLQSGLMIISAVLLIGGVIVWMNLLPLVTGQEDPMPMVAFVDTLALSLIGSGAFMGGLVMAWISSDLARLEKLSWGLMSLGIIAGLCAATSPFVLPNIIGLGLALVAWLLWCLVLGIQKELPSAYGEWI